MDDGDSFGADSPGGSPGFADAPHEEDAGVDGSVQAILQGGDLVTRYGEACESAGRKVNHLVSRSLHESAAAGRNTWVLEAQGNHPMVFSTRITDADLRLFAELFCSAAPYLQRMDLSYNHITDTGIEALCLVQLHAGMLGPKARNLQYISFKGNNIGPKGCDMLCKAITTLPLLQGLDLSHNPLERAGGLMVRDLLQTSGSLTELFLADTQVDIDVLVAISAVLLAGSSKLKVCDLENPRVVTLQEEHTVHIGRMLRTNTHLREVYLGKHKMRDDGIRQLVDFLLENKTLRVLDLRCNELGAEGARHLGKLLRSDCQLTTLNLASNRIGESSNVEGIRAIADALLENRMLSHLDLNHNELCGEALQLVAGATDSNSTLESIALFHNHWDQPSSYKFHQILNDRARILPLNADIVTSEVDLRIDICLVQDFVPKRK